MHTRTHLLRKLILLAHSHIQIGGRTYGTHTRPKSSPKKPLYVLLCRGHEMHHKDDNYTLYKIPARVLYNLEDFVPSRTVLTKDVHAASAKFVTLLKKHGCTKKFWEDLQSPVPPTANKPSSRRKTTANKPSPRRKAKSKAPSRRQTSPHNKTRRRAASPRRKTTASPSSKKQTPPHRNDRLEQQLMSLEKRIIDATSAARAAAQAAQAATASVTNLAEARKNSTIAKNSLDVTPDKKPSSRRSKHKNRSRRKHTASRRRSPSSSPSSSSSTSPKESPRSKRYRRKLIRTVTERAFNMCQMMTYSPIISTPPLMRPPLPSPGLTQYMQYPFQNMFPFKQ